jgi:RNA polymerase sigma-70 factor, ECF subfamily
MSVVIDRMLPAMEFPTEFPTLQANAPSTAPDGMLVARLIAGDDSALGTIYDRFGSMIYGLARSVSHDEQIAREVTQDVLTHVWEFPGRVDLARGSLKSYLATMAHRRSVDAVRKSERIHRVEDRVRSGSDPVVGSSEASVLDASARVWQADRLAALMEKLPTDQREALRLAYFEGCTYRQVAAQLGIPEGTAKSRLRLALARLREQLERDDYWAWT